MHKRYLPHGDYDHMGEATNLVNNFRVDNIIFNNDEYNDLELELIKVLEEKNIPYYQNIKELNIDNNKLYDNQNGNSNVIYTEFDGIKLLLMGDASKLTEKELLDVYSLQTVDILKVGHHVLKTSSSEICLDTAKSKLTPGSAQLRKTINLIVRIKR